MSGVRDASVPNRRVLLVTAMAFLGASAIGCAGPGHGGGFAPADAGATGDDSSVSVDAPVGPPAPGPQGIGLFSEACNKGSTTVDWSPLRRISRVEYNHMVRDLLGDTTEPANGFPPESPMARGVNFQVNTYAPASTTIVQQYLQAAETVAESAVADTNRMNNTILNGISSCGRAHDDACAKDFIAGWVNRAYRGQLDSTESAGLFDLYSTVKTQFDWTTGIQAVITAVLESARFLYIMEFGGGSATGAAVALSPYEIAARLALFLWRSVPDQTLMNDAAQGKLGTAAGVLAEAQSMLTGNNLVKAQDALTDFVNQWMELTSIQAKDTQFNTFNGDTNLPKSMYGETRLNFSQLALGNGGLTELLTSPSSYVNSNLALFYGATKASGPGVTLANSGLGDPIFTKTSLPHRAGILTNGAIMATKAHSTLPSFILRGKLVREDVLCDPIPPPPPSIPAPPTMAPDAGTTRDLLLAHQQKGTSCPTCHQYMDSIGVGFGNFDATGAFQADDANGLPPPHPPIDASGTIVAKVTGELQGTFKDVVDLTTQLASAPQVRQCFALQELRYALGRIETPGDACSAQQVYSTFSSSGFNIQALLLAIVQSDAFRYRSAATAGSVCQ